VSAGGVPMAPRLASGAVAEANSDARFQAELIGLLPHMRAFARSLTGNAAEADDLAQETMLSAWRARASYSMGSNMKAWTFRILRNQFLSDRRRSWRMEPLDPALAARTLFAADDPSAALDVSDVRRAMMQLPDEQREALILIAAAGMSYEEAAGICQTAIGTIKSRVNRARAALQVILTVGDLGDADVPAGDAAAAMYRDADALRAAAFPRAA
jgi:RNA polymerase sigma-70 factor, ECF subfamily